MHCPQKARDALLLWLNKTGRGVFAAHVHLCLGQVGLCTAPGCGRGEDRCSAPGAGHRSLHALLIFRTVIQLFVINLICQKVV